MNNGLATNINIMNTTLNYKLYSLSTLPKNKGNLFIPETTINYISSEIIEIKTNVTRDTLIEKLPSIIEEIEVGKIYQKIDDDFSIFIYPTNSAYLSSNNRVNFTQCEKVLRQHYKIPDSTIMTFFQIELKNDDTKSLINQVEYQALDGNKKILDLSLCKNSNIQVLYSIKNNTLADLSSASKFQKNGIDVFNLNDSFFNDICEPYSESNNDLILQDRIKDIYQNYSLCEANCIYDKFDFENMTILCECRIKENISTIISPINFTHTEGSSTNFDVIKCYKLVFSFKGKIHNIGFWILGAFILVLCLFLFLYFMKGIIPIKEYILDEMKKYGYIKNNKNNHSKNNNNKTNKRKKRNIKNKSKGNVILVTGKNTAKSKNSPPPKSKKTGDKIFTIKKLNIINNSSSLNIIKSGKRELLSQALDQNNKTNKDSKNSKIKNNANKSINKANNSKKIYNKKNKNKSKSKSKFRKAKNVALLPTESTSKQNPNTNFPENLENNKDLKIYRLINIDLNLSRNKNYIPPDSHIILNNYNFNEAIKYDKRETMVIVYIFLLVKQIFFHTFLYRSPLELFSLRFCLFIFIISNDLSLNALFYFNDNISKKYRYAKNLFLFAFSDNITIIILSTFISFILLTLMSKLSNSTNDIREVFRKEEDKLKADKNYVISDKRKEEIIMEIDEILKKYKIKIIILIMIEIVLMVFYWYFVTTFCHVYK